MAAVPAQALTRIDTNMVKTFGSPTHVKTGPGIDDVIL